MTASQAATSKAPAAAVRSVAVSEQILRAGFDRTRGGTLGAEEEFLLVDRATLAPAPIAADVIARSGGGRSLAPEFRTSQIESTTPVCRSVGEIARHLTAARTAIAEALGDDHLLLAVGAHPASPAPGPITDEPRYRRIADEQPWAAQRLLTCGLHVHVAVGGADRTLAVYNALRSYLPEVIALGANAPFLDGEASGLETVRPKLNQALSRSGIPPYLPSWNAYARLLAWGATSGAIPSPTHYWWDLRLHPTNGTLEVRAPDAQIHVADSAAIVAFIHSLAHHLAGRYDAGHRLALHDSTRITENAWRASRDGVGGTLLDLDSGAPVRTLQRINDLVARLEPAARTLGCEVELRGALRLARAGGGAAAQRTAHAAGGIRALVEQVSASTVGRQDALASSAAGRARGGPKRGRSSRSAPGVLQPTG